MTENKFRNIRLKLNVFYIIIFILYFFLGFGMEISLIFLTVIIHEVTHTFIALKRNIKVKEIELYPFGGVARFESFLGIDPKDEIIISIAGPLANFVLTLVFFLLKELIGEYLFLSILLKINVYMFLFNMLPLFPLDGGRVLRAYLSSILGIKSSTKFLSNITFIVSAFLVLIGIYRMIVRQEGINVIILALFLMIAAKNERKMAAFIFIKEITSKKEYLIRKKIMKIQFLVCLKSIRGCEAIDLFLPRRYHILIVIDENGKSIAEISENELVEGIIQYGINETLENLLKKSKK